jgi:hypothetical protein
LSFLSGLVLFSLRIKNKHWFDLGYRIFRRGRHWVFRVRSNGREHHAQGKAVGRGTAVTDPPKHRELKLREITRERPDPHEFVMLLLGTLLSAWVYCGKHA